MADNIDTRLVYGFLGAGKTTHIMDCIRNDTFYKRGRTLIICFEEGEAEYDAELLREKNTVIEYYDNEAGDEPAGFCSECIAKHEPDRIYVEMNAMIPGLKDELPERMRVTYAVTWLEWATLPVYITNFRKMINDMVSASHQITFRGCPSKDLLAPYSQQFRLMNQKASYLRQDPMGYHEKAFDLFLPFSLDDPEIKVSTGRFIPLWLDAFEHPEHYEGKTLKFTGPLELRKNDDGSFSAGRIVMVCCMADLQFMSFRLTGDPVPEEQGWVTLDAEARVGTDEYGRKKLVLRQKQIMAAMPPETLILDGTR